MTTTRKILVASVMLLLVGFVAARQMMGRNANASSASAEGAPAGSARLAEQEPRDPVAPANTPQASNVGKPTREEEQVLVMYDGMADALERNASDCEAMGLAVEEVVMTHRAQVARLMAARAQLNEASKQAAQQRLEAAAQSRLGRVREGLRAGLSSCGTDERLISALSKLAELNAPG